MKFLFSDANACYNKPCLHGNCTVVKGGFSCKCSQGYKGRNCNVKS